MRSKLRKVPRMTSFKELLEHSVSHHGEKDGFKELGPQGEIITRSFANLARDVEAFGTALIDVGIAGKHTALISEGSYSFIVAYLAVVTSGGVIVPMDKELSTDEMIMLTRKCDAEVLFYGDVIAHEVPAFLEDCPRLEYLISIDAYRNTGAPMNFTTMVQAGRNLLAEGDTRWRQVPDRSDEMSTILFTSGTTGPNKGVMLTPHNILTTAWAGLSMHEYPDRAISVLPMNHAYEFNLHVIGAIQQGITLCINDSILHVQQNLRVFEPKMSLMVPMIVTALYKNIWKQAEQDELAKHLRWGVWVSGALRRFGLDFRWIYFKPIHERLGGLRFIVSGGAPLSAEVVKGMDAVGISVYNGYGITECSPLVAVNTVAKSVPGSAGLCCPGCEVRIDNPDEDGIGEILVRGDNVMLGYYKDPEATAETFTDDGWFKTGDFGWKRSDGVLFVTGRKKNLIILPNGKNVQPEEIEEVIADRCEYVRELLVYQHTDADGHECIALRAYVDPVLVHEIGRDAADAKLRSDVYRINSTLTSYKRVVSIELLEVEFEKTSTRKIKRNNGGAGTPC